ncbi:MAG: hypothetical protein PHU25_17655 [Deltaproteobacteria bacterium]|nr:hypothetical protein [Deltaproteobacteria bacterium]
MGIVFASGCSGKATSSGPDAAPDAGDGGPDSSDPALIVEPKIPPANCDVAFDRVYEIPGTVSARAWSVVELPSGHFVVAGEAEPETPTSITDMDGFLMEVDENGEVVWTHLYGQEDTGGRGFEVFRRVHLMQGGLLALGTKVDDSENGGAWAVFTEPDGGMIWSDILPTSGTSNTFQIDDNKVQYWGGNDAGKKILATICIDGGFEEQYQGDMDPYFIVGWDRISNGYSAFFGNLYVDNVEGNYLPDDTTYSYPYISILGPDYTRISSRMLFPGRSAEFTAAIGAHGDHSLFGGWLLYDDWFWGAYMAKVNVKGEVLWQRFYGLSGCNGVDDILTVSGGYLFVGEIGGYGIYDGYIGKVDENGHLLWHFSPDHEGENGFSSVIQTSDGSFLALGVAEYYYKGAPYKTWLVKLTPNAECY